MIEIQMIGNLGGDAVIREIGGKRYLSFAVAASRKYLNAEGVECEQTTWVSCLRNAEDGQRIGQYLKKGVQVFVRGRVAVKTYVDNFGKPRSGLDCMVQTLQLVGNPRDIQAQQPATAAPVATAPQMPENENDLPF